MIEHDRTLSHGLVRVVVLGTGPPLLLIHGLGGTWRNWEANIRPLAANHRVITLDLPGFGMSAPYVGTVSVHRYVDTIVELLDDLSVDRAVLVGNSLGGLLTIETTARHPERVAAVVLVDSGGIPLTSLKERLWTLPGSHLLNRLLRRDRIRRAVGSSQGLRNIISKQIFHDPSKIPLDLLPGLVQGLGAPGFSAALAAGHTYDARQRAPQITCPAMVLWGREDPLLPVSMGHELHNLIPQSHFEVWERTGHCPMLEDAHRFNALVSAFVQDHWATDNSRHIKGSGE